MSLETVLRISLVVGFLASAVWLLILAPRSPQQRAKAHRDFERVFEVQLGPAVAGQVEARLDQRRRLAGWVSVVEAALCSIIPIRFDAQMPMAFPFLLICVFTACGLAIATAWVFRAPFTVGSERIARIRSVSVRDYLPPRTITAWPW